MVDYSQITKPKLAYSYEFSLNELKALSACVAAHGFGIIKNVLPHNLIEKLKEGIWQGTDPERTLGPGDSRTRHAWVESGSGAWQMMEYQPFMQVHHHLIDSEQLTIHRSAAIIRMQGSQPVSWHTDWCGFENTPPQNSSDILNRGLWPSGKWFYLTGSRPVHGGLCVIEDSHVENWAGPAGFKLTANKKSFYPADMEEHNYSGFDIPGLVPLFTEPGDMIIFAHRTYHGAFSNQLAEPRLSCAIGFRDRRHRIDIPWEIPLEGQHFLATLPQHLQQYTTGYTSINLTWKR